MARMSVFTLSEEALIGLFFIQRYRFLTIDQFTRASGLIRSTAAEQLRFFERLGLLGFFGNTRLAGHGKTPKAYFLTRKGYELLARESELPDDLIGNYTEVKVEAKWAPQMYHRLRTVDTLISAEIAVRNRPHLSIVKTFLEYRRIKRNGQLMRETTDFVAEEEISENKIVPDGAFIIENLTSNKRALFFLEMDMSTERIISILHRDNRSTLHFKFSQYDRYLQSMRYKKTYGMYGDFDYFVLLFVTLQQARVENIRRELSSLPQELSPFYRLTTFDKAMEDFLGSIWFSRSLTDATIYSLVKE